MAAASLYRSANPCVHAYGIAGRMKKMRHPPAPQIRGAHDGVLKMAQLKRTGRWTKGVMAMAGLLLGSLVPAGFPAFAQEKAPAAPGGGMMNNGMPNAKGAMVMNEEMQQKMSRMMENCNRMMETMMQNKGGTAMSPPAPNKG